MSVEPIPREIQRYAERCRELGLAAVEVIRGHRHFRLMSCGRQICVFSRTVKYGKGRHDDAEIMAKIRRFIRTQGAS